MKLGLFLNRMEFWRATRMNLIQEPGFVPAKDFGCEVLARGVGRGIANTL
jgi:hypothetical protein